MIRALLVIDQTEFKKNDNYHKGLSEYLFADFFVQSVVLTKYYGRLVWLNDRNINIGVDKIQINSLIKECKETLLIQYVLFRKRGKYDSFNFWVVRKKDLKY